MVGSLLSLYLCNVGLETGPLGNVSYQLWVLVTPDWDLPSLCLAGWVILGASSLTEALMLLPRGMAWEGPWSHPTPPHPTPLHGSGFGKALTVWSLTTHSW